MVKHAGSQQGLILRLEILPEGVGSKPIILEATQVVIKGDNGEPVQLAAEQGPPGVLLLSNVYADDFNEALQQIGYDITVICKKL
jgi:hypothetical protein